MSRSVDSVVCSTRDRAYGSSRLPAAVAALVSVSRCGQLGPAPLEQPQAGLGREVAGEGQAQPEAAGILGPGPALAAEQGR